MKPTEVKEILSHIIKTLSDDPSVFLQNPSKDFSRNRKLSFESIIKLMIGMGGNSLCKELYDWFDYSEDTASVSAFVQQRNKISSKAIEYIFGEMVKQCDEQILFKGYRLLAVDGSDIRLPKNKDDENSHIKNDENTKGYNLLHLDAMYDLMQHIYVDASIQSKKGMNEHKALVSMIEESEILGNVIVIADRGYESFNNIAHFQEKNWNYIIRSKESYGIKYEISDNDEFDIEANINLTRRKTKATMALIQENPLRYRWIQPHTTFDYLLSKENRMYDLKFRIVRIKISDTAYETLFTNLSANEFPAEVLKELYKMRWSIETSFKELKYNVGLASIHSKKQDFILQEIFSKLIMYNFAALISYQVEHPNDKRINFAKAIHFCYQYFKDKISERSLLEIVQKFMSPIRPGRVFERYQNIKESCRVCI
jgi:hypothetical protein